MRIGADFQYGTCRFSVWAPYCNQVTLSLTKDHQYFAMEKAGEGYWAFETEGLEPNTEYMYRLDGKDVKPDPASHFQPNGVFGSSTLVDHDAFVWKDRDWHGLDIKDSVFYELHVGTFTPEGTFRAMLSRVKELSEFGINAIELMPITQFSGQRNWGYDGVFPFAVQNTYGNPDELKALVNECHLQNVALFVDFVYNHLGPEGNCLNDYGPYLSSNRMGRWGPTVNLDGPLNEGVRNYFLENTLHWLSHYHIDGIRLDAVLSMQDTSPKHFLQELNEKVHSYAETTGKKFHLIAESGFNEPKVLTPTQQGGFGFDAQWLDDFQHALFTLLTGEKEGYYRNYGNLQDLIEVLSDAYVYVGGELEFKRKAPSESYSWTPADKFVVFSQNHDQVGNRLLGDRLTSIAGFEAAKLAAGLVLMSPYVPLLFMGEEYGETAPFRFFSDYQGKELVDAIRESRKKEFADFHWQGKVPDPQSIETYEKSKINWQLRYAGSGEKIAKYYNALIGLRKKLPIFHTKNDRQINSLSRQNENILFIHKQNENSEAGIIANFSNQQTSYSFPFEDGSYVKILDSADTAWDGPGSNLRDRAVKGDNQEIQSFGFSVYLKLQLKEGESVV